MLMLMLMLSDDIIGVFVVFCAKPFSPAAAAAGEEEEDTF